jgi:prepilin-type N-terminal cleavage/methylation domain-containing protein
MRRKGFTLIEMTIIITIIGLISAIALGRLSHFTYQARVNALAANVLNITFKIDEYQAIEGDYPTSIEAEWFVGRSIPVNPFAQDPDKMVILDSSDDPTLLHPPSKIYADDGSAADAAYWYNPANGMVRALICARPTQEDTIRLYNVVNGARIDSLADAQIQADAQVALDD